MSLCTSPWPAPARLAGWLGTLAGFLLLVAASALFTLTQTPFGRNLVAGYLEGRLEAAFQGEVELGPILAGNLLNRALVERFAISEPGGEPFVELDSVFLSYDLTGFLRGDFTFRQVAASRGSLRLLQAEDGTWNVDRIFGGEGEGEARALRLALYDVRIGSGQVELRRPWASGLEGAARDSAVAAGLRGDALWRVEATPGGRYEQVVELESLRGRFPLLRLVHPRLPMTLVLEDVAAVLKAVQLPLDVLRFDGRLVFRDSVEVAIRWAELPASRLTGSGWVAPGDPAQYRFELRAQPAGFSDLQWLPIPVPTEGGGPMELTLYTRGDVSLVEVREGDAVVRDSRLEGSFTVALEDPPRFEGFDLRFAPLRLALLDELLDRPSLIDGHLAGRVTGSGPIDGLRIRGGVTLRDLEGGGAPSSLEAEGGVSIVEPFPMRDLHLRFREFEPRWARALGLALDLEGRLQGTLTLDGHTAGRLAFAGDLSHTPPTGATSRLTGRGSLDMAEPGEVDVQLEADPLSLALLDPYFPNLRLTGMVRGPLSARGRLSDLLAEADLATPRGGITFTGRFDLEAERKRYDAEVTAREIDLRQWAEAGPETRLAVRGRVTGEGTDPATLEARFDLEILPSVFVEARVDTSLLRFRVADGLATVDTFALRGDVGEVRGRGGFGLTPERSGTVVLDIEAPDLARWNRWVVPGRSGAAPPEEPEDLFLGFPEPPGGPSAEPGETAATLPDTLAGSLAARGVLFGNVDRFSFGGRLAARSVAYGPYGADSLHARLDAAAPGALDSLVVNATAWNLRVPVGRSDSLTVRLERRGPGPANLRLAAVRDTSFELDLRGDVAWTAEEKNAAFDRLRVRVGRQALTLAGPALVSYGDSGLVARDFVLTGADGELVSARGEVPADGSASFDLEFRGLRLEELWSPRPDAPALSGELRGALAVRGTARDPRMEASLRVERPAIGRVAYPLLEGDFRYESRRVRGTLVLHGEGRALARAEGEVRADLAFRGAGRRISEDAFDFRVVADSLPLEFLELVAGGLRDVRGATQGDVRVTGGPGDLRLDGEARVAGAEARLPNLGVRFVEVAGRAAFRGSEARLDSLALSSSRGGRARATGTVNLSDVRDPAFDLHISAGRLHAVDRRRMSFLVSGDARLGGSYREPTLDGRVRISNGDVREEEFLRTRTIIDLTDPEVYGLIDTTVVAERRLLERVQNPFMQNLRLDVKLDVGPDLWLRSDVLDVELVGEGVDVRMDRAEGSIVMFGTLRLVRGSYVFDRIPPYRQQLRITGGTIEFVGVPGLNPNLQITAEYRTRTQQGPVTILVLLGGTMRQTELVLRSDPPMAQSDQLCFLALGSPCGAAADVRQAERIAREVALGTIGTGLASALVGDVGLRLDYLALRSARPVNGMDDADVGDSFFTGTELEVGKFLGSNLFVTVSQQFGTRYPGWSIEWRFTPRWTLEARAENRFARRFGLSTGSSLEFDQTFGVSIFREWSF